MAYNKNPLSKWGGVNPFKVEHQNLGKFILAKWSSQYLLYTTWLSILFHVKEGIIIPVNVIKTNARCSVECYSLKL